MLIEMDATETIPVRSQPFKYQNTSTQKIEKLIDHGQNCIGSERCQQVPNAGFCRKQIMTGYNQSQPDSDHSNIWSSHTNLIEEKTRLNSGSTHLTLLSVIIEV
jgi:hypothetical protein